jgi:hypothetical protein
MMINSFIDLTPNPFASVTDSTTDDEIIDIALNLLFIEKGILCPFTRLESRNSKQIDLIAKSMVDNKLAEITDHTFERDPTMRITTFGQSLFKDFSKDSAWTSHILYLKSEKDKSERIEDCKHKINKAAFIVSIVALFTSFWVIIKPTSEDDKYKERLDSLEHKIQLQKILLDDMSASYKSLSHEHSDVKNDSLYPKDTHPH